MVWNPVNCRRASLPRLLEGSWPSQKPAHPTSTFRSLLAYTPSGIIQMKEDLPTECWPPKISCQEEEKANVHALEHKHYNVVSHSLSLSLSVPQHIETMTKNMKNVRDVKQCEHEKEKRRRQGSCLLLNVEATNLPASPFSSPLPSPSPPTVKHQPLEAVSRTRISNSGHRIRSGPWNLSSCRRLERGGGPTCRCHFPCRMSCSASWWLSSFWETC